MHLKIKVRNDRTRGQAPEWVTASDWPDSDCPPRQGELIVVEHVALRVVTVLRTGPTSATAYVEATHLRTEPGEVPV